MLRQFSLSIKVPLTRVEVLLLYEQTLNPATMKAEQKRLAELINNPISILKVDCPAQSKNVTPFSLQTASKTQIESKREISADCQETLEQIHSFVKANNICMAEWLQAFNADNSSLIKLDELTRALAKLNIPISKLDQRQLF